MKSARNIAVVFMLVLLVLAVASQVFAQDYGWVCHKPGTNAEKSMYLPVEAQGSNDVNGHLGHGDSLGQCGASVEVTEAPATPTATPIPPTPTATPTQEPVATVTSSPVVTPTATVEATSQPVSLPTSEPASCELPVAGQECDSCAIVREALAQGKMILIVDEEHVSIFSGNVQVYAGTQDEPVVRAGNRATR